MNALQILSRCDPHGVLKRTSICTTRLSATKIIEIVQRISFLRGGGFGGSFAKRVSSSSLDSDFSACALDVAIVD